MTINTQNVNILCLNAKYIKSIMNGKTHIMARELSPDVINWYIASYVFCFSEKSKDKSYNCMFLSVQCNIFCTY